MELVPFLKPVRWDCLLLLDLSQPLNPILPNTLYHCVKFLVVLLCQMFESDHEILIVLGYLILPQLLVKEKLDKWYFEIIRI